MCVSASIVICGQVSGLLAVLRLNDATDQERMGMVQVFQDDESSVQHDDFEQWKASHPNGFVVSVKTSAQGVLHKAGCAKLAGPHQTPAEGKSRTTSRKVCLDETERSDISTILELSGLTVVDCQSCKP